MTDQTSADPVAVSLSWLKAHATVVAAFGTTASITGVVESPWPHLRVAPGAGGDLRGGRWDLDEDVLFEVIGSPDGSPGEAEMRRLAMVVVQAMLELPDRAHTATDPVVCQVRPVGHPRPGQAPWTLGQRGVTTSGQSKWSITMNVAMHPPIEEPEDPGS